METKRKLLLPNVKPKEEFIPVNEYEEDVIVAADWRDAFLLIFANTEDLNGFDEEELQ